MTTILESPFNNFTSLTFNAGEGCDEGNPCPEGDVCIEGKCYQKCNGNGDCPSHQDCRSDLFENQGQSVCGDPIQGEVDDLLEVIKQKMSQSQIKAQSVEPPQDNMMWVWGGLATGALILGGGYYLLSNKN